MPSRVTILQELTEFAVIWGGAGYKPETATLYSQLRYL
jgi:hypothetical protein